MTQTFSPEVIQALAELRHKAAGYVGMTSGTAHLVNTLDNAGVFAALDEQTGYAAAEDILAEAAATAPLDPAEWGDTTSADMAQHQRSGELDADDRKAMGALGRKALGLRPKGRTSGHIHAGCGLDCAR